MIRLKNWSIFLRDIHPFRAPELATFHLSGNTYGDPRFNAGDPVNTSRIVDVEDKGDYKIARTRSGSEYVLYREDVNPEAEKQFPGYYDRLKIRR